MNGLYTVQRMFKLATGKQDWQYVSSVNSKGWPVGYDRDVKHAVKLGSMQHQRAQAYLRDVGAEFKSYEVTL